MATKPSTRSSDLETQTPERAEPAKIWKARRFIEEHAGEELSLTTVARFVNISPNHLSEKFKEVTGVKFVDYIARRRFAKACALLQNRQLRISEIAFEVGFQSLSQFNRVFRRFTGKSPTEYRALKCPPVEPAVPHTNGQHRGKTLTEEMRSRSPAASTTLRGSEAINRHAVSHRQS